MEEREGISFVTIPIEVFKSDKLTLAEKHLYGWLSLFKKQCCFMSNEAIAEATGLSVPSITRGLKSLADMGYIFIEYVAGNNAKRRIYTIFDNPAKLKYLMKKGLFAESNQNDESVENSVENLGGSNQNDEMSNQNDESQNRGESNQNDEHKIKNINKIYQDEVQKPALNERFLTSPKRMTKRDEYKSEADFEKAFYMNNTFRI